jgi:magnesium-transporting ATPase (P-type)
MERMQDVFGVPSKIHPPERFESTHLLPQSNNDDQETATFTLQAPGMSELVDIAALNSRVKFDKTDVPFDQRQILGDATETGLTRFAGRQLRDYDEHHKKFPSVFEVPFNSTNKWALVIVSLCVVFVLRLNLTFGVRSTSHTRTAS